MEGAEGCCRALLDAQLCTLALVGTGAEIHLRAKREKTVTLCTALEQLLLCGVRSSDNSTLDLFLI